MDTKYILLGVAVLLGLIFIQKLWKIFLILAIGAAAYWYFFVR